MQNLNGKRVVITGGGQGWVPAQLGEQVAELLRDPRYRHGVAYGFRSGSDILPLDVTYDSKGTAITGTR